jgi:hypothetical protein
MKQKLILIVGLITSLLLASQATATIVTIEIEGVVNDVNDDNNMLEGQITSGMTFTGSYTYNSDTPDEYPLDYERGIYWHYTQPYGISVTINNVVFETDLQNVKFDIAIENKVIDTYWILNSNNIPLPNGKTYSISWGLTDYSGTAVSSDVLPTGAPILNHWDSNHFQISRADCGDSFGISGTVTSAVLIPEPISLSMLFLGVLLTRNRFKRLQNK